MQVEETSRDVVLGRDQRAGRIVTKYGRETEQETVLKFTEMHPV